MILNKRIPFRYWFHKIKWDMLFVLVFSTTVSFVKEFIDDIDVPITIAANLGTAITLLLSFKLAQSYDRWWEARKIWGSIVNDSRSLVLQVKNFTHTENIAVVQTIANRQIAWCYALTAHLRKLEPLENISSFLSEIEMEVLKKAAHVPLAILDFNTGDVVALQKSGHINDYQQIQIDRTLVELTASMGKAERIKNTVFPKTYRKVLHLFIYIFLVLLSFALVDMKHFWEIPMLVTIAIPFFLLEKIALSIQDPFENKHNDTAMTNISQAIEKNIKELLSEEIPEFETEETYYVL